MWNMGQFSDIALLFPAEVLQHPYISSPLMFMPRDAHKMLLLISIEKIGQSPEKVQTFLRLPNLDIKPSSI